MGELNTRAQRGEIVCGALRKLLCNDVALKATQDRIEKLDWKLHPESNSSSGEPLSGGCNSGISSSGSVYKVDDYVEILYTPDGNWYPGTITAVCEHTSYDVLYDDGCRER